MLTSNTRFKALVLSYTDVSNNKELSIIDDWFKVLMSIDGSSISLA